MRKWLVVAAGVLGVVLVLCAGGGALVFYAARRQPTFYREALAADPNQEREASDKMLEEATSLASEAVKEGGWEATFTAEEINGWLAVDLEKNYPDLLPKDVEDPRVEIQPEKLTVAVQYRGDRLESVLSLSVDAYLAEPNVLALRIRQARAGLIPLPLNEVLERLTDAATDANLRVEWRQEEGDPVALVTLPPANDEDDNQIEIKELRLEENAVYVAGTTERKLGGKR